MEVRYEFQGLHFEWDLDKAISNLANHRVSFETACEVFFDPYFQLTDADDNDEARDGAIGYSEDSKLLFVVHLVRSEERIRIISARPASAREKAIYEDY